MLVSWLAYELFQSYPGRANFTELLRLEIYKNKQTTTVATTTTKKKQHCYWTTLREHDEGRMHSPFHHASEQCHGTTLDERESINS